LIERGGHLFAVSVARAARSLSESAGGALPASISATLTWAAERQLPEVDVLYIPPPYKGDDPSIEEPPS
jgi:hypothetical protein